jgi:hypothetical protein
MRKPMTRSFDQPRRDAKAPRVRWRMENGADPNDGALLYHATGFDHIEWLRLLPAHGISDTEVAEQAPA